MIRKQKDGIVWLEFELLAEVSGLSHGVFLRHGGVGKGPFKSLHVGRSMSVDANEGSDTQEIEENLMRIKNVMRIDSLISAYQVHGTSIEKIDYLHQDMLRCDGLMTNQKDLALMIKHADCQAVILYDPEHRAIANVHCGWRGNVQNIYSIAVQNMLRQFGSKPENLLVGISPSLGPEKSEFINYRTELPLSFMPFQIKPSYFDLWAIARMQLEEAGVLPHHIEVAGICTYSHEEDFFSFRRDSRLTGNHATIAVLRNAVK